MKKILEKLTACMVGVIIALLTWDMAILALLTYGRLQTAFQIAFFAGVCLTTYWALVPREVDRKLTLRRNKKAARRAGTR